MENITPHTSQSRRITPSHSQTELVSNTNPANSVSPDQTTSQLLNLLSSSGESPLTEQTTISPNSMAATNVHVNVNPHMINEKWLKFLSPGVLSDNDLLILAKEYDETTMLFDPASSSIVSTQEQEFYNTYAMSFNF